MKFLFDLFPVLLFFGVFRWAEGNTATAQALVNKTLSGIMSGGGVAAAQAPIILATAVAIIATIGQIGYLLARRKKVDVMLWLSFAIIAVFGGMTIYFNSEDFIKWKPTVLYWCFALVLLASQVIFRKNLIRALMGAQINLPDPIWTRLSYAWMAFLALMGVINLYVAFWGSFSTSAWVNFKLFGGMGLMFAFIIGQSLYLSKYMKDAA